MCEEAANISMSQYNNEISNNDSSGVKWRNKGENNEIRKMKENNNQSNEENNGEERKWKWRERKWRRKREMKEERKSEEKKNENEINIEIINRSEEESNLMKEKRRKQCHRQHR